MIGTASLSNIKAQRLPEENEDRHKEEFAALLAIFQKFLDTTSDMEAWEVLEELMSLRAEFAISYAFRGFDIDYATALELLRNTSRNLSEEEKAKRDVLVAAVDNLVDFAVAEEYQVLSEFEDWMEDDGEESDEDDDEVDGVNDKMLAIFNKYNNVYAKVENKDTEYAMIVAAQIVAASNNTMLTYMTQGDERVRPWHLQYEGFSAPKSQFPAWLIPPIEHACRCFLVEDSIVAKLPDIQNAMVRVPEMPEWFNPTFKDSVAFGGRIFSDAHPYFIVDDRYATQLKEIATRIKNKYLNGN